MGTEKVGAMLKVLSGTQNLAMVNGRENFQNCPPLLKGTKSLTLSWGGGAKNRVPTAKNRSQKSSWNFVISHGILPVLSLNCTKFVFFWSPLRKQ